jgi:hypothetical protein
VSRVCTGYPDYPGQPASSSVLGGPKGGRHGSAKDDDRPRSGPDLFLPGPYASYEAARRGDIPTLRIGRLLRVPVAALDRKLEEAGNERA